MRFFKLFILLCLFASPVTARMDPTLREDLFYRTALGSPQDVDLLLKKVGAANIVNDAGQPLLYVAATRTDALALPVVEMVLKHGANVNFHGGKGFYPLLRAVETGNVEMVKRFVAAGANYTVKDPVGADMKMIAALHHEPQMLAYVEQILKDDPQMLMRQTTRTMLDRLTYQLAYHTCAHEYHRFYYETKADPIPQKTQYQTLSEHEHKRGIARTNLHRKFYIATDELERFEPYFTKKINGELTNLISNRWRRQKGVGKPGDMEKRCEAIAAPVKQNYFDFRTKPEPRKRGQAARR